MTILDRLRALIRDPSYTGTTGEPAYDITSDGSAPTKSTLSGERAEFFFKYVGAAFRFFVRRRKYDLKWKEFMVFTFVMQLPLGYWLRHTRIVKRWGASLTLMVHIVVGICLAMPIFMVYMFMGNYSRKSYIRFWACVPIMKGLAYSIALRAIFLHIFDLSISGMAILYFLEMFQQDVPWTSCLFDHADFDCMGTYHDKVHNETCCGEFQPNCSFEIQLESSAKFSALDFYWEYMLGMDFSQNPKYRGLNWSWVLSVEFLWILIFILMLMGLRRFRGIMTGINRIIFIIIVPVGAITMYMGPSYATISDIYSNYSSIKEYSFWVETIMAAFHREVPGDVITFSAISSPGLTTTVDSITVYSMKICFMTMLTVWMSIGVIMIQKNYNVFDSRCIPLEGDILVFAILPDIISRWTMPQFWLIIYFLVIFYWGFSTSVYVFNSFLEALLEEFPSLMKWKVLICAVFCITLGFINSLNLNPEFIVLFKHLTDTTMAQVKAFIILFSLLGLFLYTVGKVKADYHFTYGVFLPRFWTESVKIGILFMSGVCIMAIINTWQYDDHKYIVFVVLSPFPIGIIISIILYQRKKIPTLLEPDPSWGPPSFKVRQARARFDPTYNIRHTGMYDSCKHACLRGLYDVRQEVKHWKRQKEHFERLYETTHDPSPLKRKPDILQLKGNV